MAKGLNLINTGYEKIEIMFNPDGLDALIRSHIPVYDDQGELIRVEVVEESFTSMSAQRKVNLNNYLRLSNQKNNQDLVSENKSTWVDIN